MFHRIPWKIHEDVRIHGEVILYLDANYLTKYQIECWVNEVASLSQQEVTWFYWSIYEKNCIIVKGLGDLEKIRNITKEMLPTINNLISDNFKGKGINVPVNALFTERDVDYFKQGTAMVCNINYRT